MTIRIQEEQQGKQGDGVDHVEADVGDGAEEGDRPGVAASADDGQHLEQVRKRQGGADRQEDPSRPVPGLFRDDQRADRHPAHAARSVRRTVRAPCSPATDRIAHHRRPRPGKPRGPPRPDPLWDRRSRRSSRGGSGGAVTRSMAEPLSKRRRRSPRRRWRSFERYACSLVAHRHRDTSGPAVTSMPRWSHPRPPRARGRTPPLRQVPPPPPTVVAAGSSSQVRGPTVRSQTTARRR